MISFWKSFGVSASLRSESKGAVAHGRCATFLRFLVSGGVNTFLTYVAYLVLLQYASYRVSYTVAYVFGIFLAYVLYRAYVFRQDARKHGLVLVAAVYLAQYLAGLGIVSVWVDRLGGPVAIAPVVAVVLTLPVTYYLNSLIFRAKTGRIPAASGGAECGR